MPTPPSLLYSILLAPALIVSSNFLQDCSTDPTPTPGPAPTHDCQVFPDDNPWNTDISQYPVHENSDNYIASIGENGFLHPDFGTTWLGVPNGIPSVYVDDTQALVPISFVYDDESDPGPYPIPPDAPIEGGDNGTGDRHVIALNTDTCLLYELYNAWPVDEGGSWRAGSGAIFDLNSNTLRPDGWTSADAAGLPIFPGLIRYSEAVEAGEIRHALRFTVVDSQRGFIHPATHFASDKTDENLPPMGLRLRMKSDYDCSAFSQEVQVICTAFKTYGMFMADNGSDWFISGEPDARWNDNNLHQLDSIPGSAFEAVYSGEIITSVP